MTDHLTLVTISLLGGHMNASQRGDVLISALIGVALVGILVVAGMTLLSNLNDGISSATFQKIALSHQEKVRLAFSGGDHCRLNLLNRPMPAEGASLSFQDFFYANASGNSLSSEKITGVGPTEDGINIKSINVINEKQLAPREYLARVQIIYTRENTLGPREIMRSTPILLSTNASNRIQSCTIPEDALSKCDRETRFVSGYGMADLPEGRLTQMVIFTKYIDCECRVSGWVCRNYTPPPPPPPPSPSGDGGSGGDASADCASGDSGF